jgi:hypothetical protein
MVTLRTVSTILVVVRVMIPILSLIPTATVVASITLVVIAVAIIVSIPASAIVAVTSESRSSNPNGGDTTAPVFAAVIRNVQLSQIADVTRCESACTAEIRIIEVLDLYTAVDTDGANPVIEAGRNCVFALPGADTEGLAAITVIREETCAIARRRTAELTRCKCGRKQSECGYGHCPIENFHMSPLLELLSRSTNPGGHTGFADWLRVEAIGRSELVLTAHCALKLMEEAESVSISREIRRRSRTLVHWPTRMATLPQGRPYSCSILTNRAEFMAAERLC